MTGIRLALVTLAYNNVEEVRKTLASIALQSVQPDRILVVDSSQPGLKEDIEKLVLAASANYVWVQPDGVYPAMNRALDEVADDCFVWFINSSDWLAGQDSVRQVAENLTEEDSWALGGLYRLGDERQPFHPIPANSREFLTLLRSGAIGFPHPSAVMSRRVIGELGGFDESFRIAGDYDLALKCAENFGPPRIIPHMLSVHVPTGLTSRNKIRHVWEKSVARRRVLGNVSWVKEVVNLVAIALRQLGFMGRWSQEIFPFPTPPGFGAEFDAWPDGKA